MIVEAVLDAARLGLEKQSWRTWIPTREPSTAPYMIVLLFVSSLGWLMSVVMCYGCISTSGVLVTVTGTKDSQDRWRCKLNWCHVGVVNYGLPGFV